MGLFLCSHNPAVVERAVFRDVRLIRPAKEGFVPYRDYIGSVLEILDVASGRRQVVLSSAQPFEAPNWTRDGSALIYNTSGRVPETRGRLFRFDLATRQASLIDTGIGQPQQQRPRAVLRRKHDRHQRPEHDRWAIHDLHPARPGRNPQAHHPADAVVPARLVARRQAPRLHRRHATASSTSTRSPSDGSGTEVKLTDWKGLDDGPEYTPDGKYIYFNSVRGGGTMQIWRMKPDGTDPEAVTNDELNNWFPHLSPDGQWIAFISFPKTVDPSDHPYYKHVTLRLMPIAGGAARVIAYVYGGQGTINVPSWSPDGTMLAFVSNSDMN